uniref:Uncharacterized protein n=1 Tax=Arundo donax TaxID=35708 RepID=A0A0A9FDK6_ARUDO
MAWILKFNSKGVMAIRQQINEDSTLFYAIAIQTNQPTLKLTSIAPSSCLLKFSTTTGIINKKIIRGM